MSKRRTSESKQQHQWPQSSSNLSQVRSVSQLILHRRFCSDWADDVIRINIAHHQVSQETIRPFNLGAIQLAAYGGESVFKVTVPLATFPHLVNALKCAINSALHFYDKGAVEIEIVKLISNCQRIFIWMMRRGIYHLEQLTMMDTDFLAKEVGRRGWWAVLDYDAALKGAVLDATKNREILKTLIGVGHTSKIKVNFPSLTTLIGLPLGYTDIPSSFVAKLSRLAQVKLPVNLKKPSGLKRSRGGLKATLTAANRLANLPGEFDAISFYPYPKVNDKLIKFFGFEDNTTANLPLEHGVKIFQESLKWIYDYGPGVVELCNVARNALEGVQKNRCKHFRVVSAAILKAYPAIKKKYGLPFDLTGKSAHAEAAFINKLVDAVQTAAVCLIAFNHGRRRNEVIGKKKHYGLYFGCVREIFPGSSQKKIDVYVEKSPQDYTDFWCNRLVEDCVTILEQISQCFRPLRTNAKKYAEDLSDARADKLLTSRRFTFAGFRSPATTYNFSSASVPFLELAGVPTSCLKGTRVFRRLFAILYVYRYDHPVLLALKQYMRHVSLASTERYARDPANRKEAERIETLYRQVQAGMKGAIDEIRSEHFEELLIQMLNGKQLGGFFPQLVLRLVNRLSIDVAFCAKSLEAKAHDVKEILERRGYQANEKEHALCMLGTAHGTKRHAKCNKDGRPHPEDASPNKCKGCVNALNNENYMSIYEAERSDLLVRAKNFNNPPAVRFACEKQAKQLDELLAQEREIAAENQTAFIKLSNTWQAIVLEEVEA